MELLDLLVDLREFGLDGLVGFVVSPLAAPAYEAFGVVLEFREEHACLGDFGILARTPALPRSRASRPR
ncbi:hypothetical protein [Nocardia sp. NPDC059228]|uniref:hypothetical protein n=1 Tax=Nocardia sp. NPDC059228 TaxID=3346777 RepID=UPI0036BCA564